MNKWFRLGKKFARKFTDKEMYDFLAKNNLVNVAGTDGKDFKEGDYAKICKLIGAEIEKEDKCYSHGERKYYFYWGFDKKKLNK